MLSGLLQISSKIKLKKNPIFHHLENVQKRNLKKPLCSEIHYYLYIRDALVTTIVWGYREGKARMSTQYPNIKYDTYLQKVTLILFSVSPLTLTHIYF